MNSRFLSAALLVMFLPVLAQAEENKQQEKVLELEVYKVPTCSCCKKWVAHVEDKGIIAYSNDYHSIGFIKNKYSIKPNYRSCHTAVTKNGVVFEGHVPAKFIKQFLGESHTDAIGLSVPAMPVGSPGMDIDDRFIPHQIIILHNDGTSNVYAKVNTYEEQF